MSEERFTAFITKYALTNGIEQYPVRISSEHPTMAVSESGGYTGYYHGEGKDWHRTLNSAIARAFEMRENKLASLRKQIAKLEKLDFV